MKITRERLKEIIKEEYSKITEGNFEEEYERLKRLDDEARAAGISEEDIKHMSEEELVNAIHKAMSLR
tara:strand:+ start:253 stop:456 length:204 start_codon:yes stop_codon:yes gene_type:complete